jgi:hypothetical protein
MEGHRDVKYPGFIKKQESVFYRITKVLGFEIIDKTAATEALKTFLSGSKQAAGCYKGACRNCHWDFCNRLAASIIDVLKETQKSE